MENRLNTQVRYREENLIRVHWKCLSHPDAPRKNDRLEHKKRLCLLVQHLNARTSDLRHLMREGAHKSEATNIAYSATCSPKEPLRRGGVECGRYSMRSTAGIAEGRGKGSHG